MSAGYKNKAMIPTWLQVQCPHLPCPICGSSGEKTLVLTVPSHLSSPADLMLYRCAECQSAYFHPIAVPDYSALLQMPSSTSFMLELGAGIDSMIRSLRLLKTRDGKVRLLEAGCNFGFLVHYATQQLGWDAVGVDPSAACLAGRHALGANIFPHYIEDVPELVGQEFDVVYASEVIEHVADPEHFICKLSKFITADGALVLTTPNAEALTADQPYVTLMACLSPGLHVNLFSPHSLVLILKRCGFEYVTVLKEGHRLFSYASARPIVLNQEDKAAIQEYINYLSCTYESVDGTSSLSLGLAYRLLKELVNCNKLMEASDWREKLTDELWRLYKLSLDNHNDLRERAGNANDFAAWGKLLPYNITSILYYAGMLSLLHSNDFEQSIKYFSLGFDLSFKLIALAPTFFDEPADLIWRQKFHEGFAQLLIENREAAIAIFQFICNHAEVGMPELPMLVPPKDVIASCLYQTGIAYFQVGQYKEAMGLFEKVLEKYGEVSDRTMISEAARHLDLCRQLIETNEERVDERKTVLSVAEIKTMTAIEESRQSSFCQPDKRADRSDVYASGYDWLANTLILASANNEKKPMFLPHNLLVSVPPTYGFGGLIWLEGTNESGLGAMRTIDRLGTTGLWLEPTCLVRALPHSQHGVVVIYCADGRVLHFALNDILSMHDLRFFEGNLYVVSTGSNEVTVVSLAGEVLRRIKFPGGNDSWHVNCLDVWDGRLVATAFGKFDESAERLAKYEGEGIVFDLLSQSVLWSGLSLPHTPRSDSSNRLFVCDSGKQRLLVKENTGVERELLFPGTFPRGISITDEYIYLGLSDWQVVPDPDAARQRARIAVISCHNLQVLEEIELPCSEVYDIVVVPRYTGRKQQCGEPQNIWV